MTEGLLLLAELVLLGALLLAVRRRARSPKRRDLGFFSYDVLDDEPPSERSQKRV